MGNTVPTGLKTASEYAWRALVVGAALAVVWLALTYFSAISVPVAIALLFTALLYPVSQPLVKRGCPPFLAALAGLGVLFLLVAGIGVLIGANIRSQFGELSGQFVDAAHTFLAWLGSGPLQLDEATLNGYISQVSSWVNDSTSEIAIWAAQAGVSAGRFIAGLAITLLSTFFFLAGGRTIWTTIVKILPQSYRERTDKAALSGWQALQSYMRAQVIVAAADAVGIFIGAVILKVPMPFALLAFTFITAFIPVVGAILAGVLAAALA
ncbi:MAG: AI-2E family transporter, partial [Propionibacteriaceae bacterium]|nr:AI-2E family transporter [Propionibacteriaceae bacterium]